MQHLQSNTTLQGGKYKIVGVLGQGGFGITYLAIQSTLNRYVAIKELFIGGSGQAINDRQGNMVVVTNSANKASFKQQLDKFRKEALRLTNLDHPNIVHVYDFFEENGTAYYVMEYIEGVTLRTKLKKGGCLSEKIVLEYVKQLLPALEVAHKQNIWHLDIKPENIMVDKNGHVYLIDFGASKHVEPNSTLTTSLALAYTPGYCPPELADLTCANQKGFVQALKEIGPWTDIYSLGATMYNLLTDSIPPSSNRLYKFGSNAFLFPDNLSAATKELIVKMMKPDKDDRPQSIQALQKVMGRESPKESYRGGTEKSKSTIHEEPGTFSVILHVSASILFSCLLCHYFHISGNLWPFLIFGLGLGLLHWLYELSSMSLKQYNFIIILVLIIFIMLSLPFLDMTNRNPKPEGIDGRPEEHVTNINNANVKLKGIGDSVKERVIQNLINNMVQVQGGTFVMGSTTGESNEKPTHKVSLSTFYIGKYEVTQEEWEVVMGNNPSRFKGSKLPVERIRWKDCQAFISKLNAITGKQFRLPTESEWEFAASGGNSSRGYKYSGGNDISDVAWYSDNSRNTTHNVGAMRANELGLYDMSGNVWEWCQDWYGSYSSSAQVNPCGSSTGSCRVIRGGCWYNNAEACRISQRFLAEPSDGLDHLGLRLAI